MPEVYQEDQGAEVVGLPARTNQGIVRSAVTPSQALEAWKSYQELCTAVLEPSDFQEIYIKGEPKKFKKKSSWRKLANFFNLTVEVKDEKEIKEDGGSFSFDVTYRATAPNGRSVTGDGSANSREHEDEDNSRHNVRGTAHTRSFNRAVSNLIGGGELSAEEMDQGKKTQIYNQEITFETKFTFGKETKGKTIKEVGFKKAFSLTTWVKDKCEAEGKKFDGQAKAIFDFCIAERDKHEAKKAQDTSVIPPEQTNYPPSSKRDSTFDIDNPFEK